jgi:hypothetical protein
MKVTDRETGEEFDLVWSDEVMADLRRHAEGECTHAEVAVRQVAIAGGSIQFRKQCQTCGELIGQAIAKNAAPADCPPNDEALFARYGAQRRKEYYDILREHARKQKARDSEWWAKYNAYLQTPKWQETRGKVLKRSAGSCEGCGQGPATQVHHRTYEHVGDEFLFELVAVCNSCHDRLHRGQHANLNDWDDDLPCLGCRWQSDKDNRPWCAQFEIFAVEALAEDGQCGPSASALEPLR